MLASTVANFIVFRDARTPSTGFSSSMTSLRRAITLLEISSRVPEYLMTPRWITVTWSQTCWTSARRCDEKKTVVPDSTMSLTMFLTSTIPTGSRPMLGSSKITSSGSLISAWAIPMRCCIPLLYFPILSFPRPSSPTILMSSGILPSLSVFDIPYIRP